MLESGAVAFSSWWRQHSVTFKTSEPASRSDFVVHIFSVPQEADKLTDYLPDDLVPRSDVEVKSSRNCSRSRGVIPGVTRLLFFPPNGENRESLHNYMGVRSIGKGNQPLMGCNSEKGGGSLALYGVHFSPSLPFIFSASSMGPCFVFSPARTEAALPCLSWRDHEGN